MCAIIRSAAVAALANNSAGLGRFYQVISANGGSDGTSVNGITNRRAGGLDGDAANLAGDTAVERDWRPHRREERTGDRGSAAAAGPDVSEATI